MIDRTSRMNPYLHKLHVSELLPDPYPRYPVMINRFMDRREAESIELEYGVSDVFMSVGDGKQYHFDYKSLARTVSKGGGYSLSEQEDAFVQFVNVLYFYCYDKYRRGDELKLTWKFRHARGAHVREYVMIGSLLDNGQVDQILETALQRRDIETIRAVLNHEGYGVPVNEPNALSIPVEWDKERDFSKIEFKITREEWAAPVEATDIVSSVEKSAVQKAFAEAIAENIPLRLERLIRQRDFGMLRMMLRVYGHNILPNATAVQDVPEQSR